MGLAMGVTKAVLMCWGHKCAYCGDAATDADHVVPRALGGSDEPRNLVASCRRCNARKSAYRLPQAIESHLLTQAFGHELLVEQMLDAFRHGYKTGVNRQYNAKTNGSYVDSIQWLPATFMESIV